MADVTSRDATEGPGEGLADSTTKGIWHSIFLEVDKVSSYPFKLPVRRQHSPFVLTLSRVCLEADWQYKRVKCIKTVALRPHCHNLISNVKCFPFNRIRLITQKERFLYHSTCTLLSANASLVVTFLLSRFLFVLRKTPSLPLLCFVVLQGADLMIGKLTNSLRLPNVSSRQAADAIKHLLHMQAEGARSARNLNPVKLYLEAQVSLAFAPSSARRFNWPIPP